MAIYEALVGLGDAACLRMAHARADALLTPGTLDEQLVLSALLKDGATARTLLPAVVAELKKTAPPGPEADVDEQTFRALAALVEGKAAEAVQLIEPLTFNAAHNDQVTIWSLAQMQLQQWDKMAKGMAWLDTPGSGVDLGPITAVALASLAKAQAAMGQTDAARKTYQKFFDLWKDADADVPLLVQAKAEFVKLGSS